MFPHQRGLGLVDATVTAAAVMELVQERLRAAFPRDWRSRTADAYATRLLDVLVSSSGTRELIEAAHQPAIACVIAATTARAADS